MNPAPLNEWRRAERQRLIAARLSMGSADRLRAAVALEAALVDMVTGLAGLTVGLYWPFRGEPVLRRWAAHVVAQGGGGALPVVVARAQPLLFRRWRPGEALVRGVWNIPVPAEGDAVEPDIVIAPLVGFDRAGYRLGYGGGFYDRTLAARARRPWVIGVGYAAAELPTIHPQAHDVPMDLLLTERERIVIRARPGSAASA